MGGSLVVWVATVYLLFKLIHQWSVMSWSSITRSTGSNFTCLEPQLNRSQHKTNGALVHSNSSVIQLLQYDEITLLANYLWCFVIIFVFLAWIYLFWYECDHLDIHEQLPTSQFMLVLIGVPNMCLPLPCTYTPDCKNIISVMFQPVLTDYRMATSVFPLYHMWCTPVKQGTSDILGKTSFWCHCMEHTFSFNLTPISSSYSSYFLRHDHLCTRP